MRRLRVLLILVATCVAISGFPRAAGTTDCAITSVGLTPLSNPGGLGLYTGGNDIPPAHLDAGLAIAAETKPLGKNGNLATNGKMVLVSIGMSNTTHEFSAWAQSNPSPNAKLVLVDTAQVGMTADRWADPLCPCWERLNVRLEAAGVTAKQVVAAWVKLTLAGPTDEAVFKTQLQSDTEKALQQAIVKFPNLKLAYLSSRVYAGYSTTSLNPEPYAYDTGLVVRALIQKQIDGQLPFTAAGRVAPWLSWGPYLWADGMTPRSDGLTWTCSDFLTDGVHPSESGKQKVAAELTNLFTTHPTTTPWFMGVVVNTRKGSMP